jgi:tetratricopeptide (TPR) repeat protein
MAPLFFNAAKKLHQAEEALAKGLFYDAMLAFQAVLKKEKADPSIEMRASGGLSQARKALMEIQISAAQGFLEEGNKREAAECCRNAIELAGRDHDPKAARDLLAAALSGSNAAEPDDDAGLLSGDDFGPEEDEDPGVPIEEAGIDSEELFTLYLSSYPEDRAAHLRGLGPEFRDGFLHVQQGRAEKALASFDGAPPGPCADPIFRLHRAQALYVLGDDARAREILDALDLPEDLRRGQAELLTAVAARQGDLDTSEAVARALASGLPDDLDAAQLLAQVLTSRRKFDEALDILLPFLDPAHVTPEIDGFIVRLLLELGRTEESVEILERAVRKSFHESLSRRATGRAGSLFPGGGLAGLGLAGGAGPAPPPEDFPLWAARTLLKLYTENRVDPRKVEKLVDSLVLLDPDSEAEYWDRLERSYLSRDEDGSGAGGTRK